MAWQPSGRFSSSTVAKRQLGRYLQDLRTTAKIRLKDAATALERSVSTLSRIEAGHAPVRAVEVEAMCRLYRAPAERTRALMQLALACKDRDKWYPYSDLMSTELDLYVALEEIATELRWYEPDLVPGIMQTPEYARAVIRAGHPGETPEGLTRRVQLRRERQALLHRSDAPSIEILLSEAVLRRLVPRRKEMAAQLTHMVEISRLANVSLRMLPFDSGLHLGALTGQFVSLEFPVGADGTPLEPASVFTAGYTGSVFLDKPEDVASFRLAFDQMRDQAISEDDTRDLMEKLAVEYDK